MNKKKDTSITKTIKTSLISPGTSIDGKYKILAEIGRGGMGVVYKATDTRLKRTVALKYLATDLSRDKDAKARFAQEAQAAAALNHPHITVVYEVGEAEGQTYFAMEFIEGQSLKEKLESGPLDINEAKDIAQQVASGLKEAHEKGIVHRDIKPANIMLTNKGQAKITDFGLAKLSWGADLTQASTIMGTVAYMSPEQARGMAVDQRTDIWSLGAMLYEMVTGKAPFTRGHEQALIYSILNDALEPVSSLRTDVPGYLEAAIQKALEKDVSKRFHNVSEFIQVLEKTPAVSTSQVDKSIAVLPFVNMSADPEQEYFCDGISEEIINALTQIGELRVVARTSAFSFKGKDADIGEIGQKLKVEKVLEGSVRKAGNRLRITAQLINVADGYHLWSERFDREMEDVFAIQDEITLAIVDKLKIKLLGKEKQELVRRHTDNQMAYSYYLKGRYFWNKMNPLAYVNAIENFEKAIELDPNCAVAYAGLADAYWWSSFWGNLPPRQTFPKAREAVKKAIEIDDTLGDAHASLASILAIYDWDWGNAEQEFKRAIELAPGSSYIRVYYSIFLTLRKRFDEAVIQSKKAQSLDPISGPCSIQVGHVLYHARRYDEAIEEFQKRLVIEPNDWFARHHLSEVYLEKSRIKEALTEIDKSVELSGGVPMNLASAAMTHYRFGDKKVADDLFEKLKARAGQEYIQPIAFAFIHWVREEMDQAFEWVKKAYEERDSFLPWIRVTPTDAWQIPRDPRIDELLDKWGLP
ncbi:MAG: protein kinase [Candidatus Aminicenantes bacterium]|nr:protein kinase [Candidatus Aminicenantes bacterium]